MQRRISNLIWTLVVLVGLPLSMNSCSARADENPTPKKNSNYRKNISEAISDGLRHNKLPEQVKFKFNGRTDDYQIDYTLDPLLQAQAQSLLKLYKPDYGAVFMMDAETGRVLAMASQEKLNPKAENLNLKATFPAASIFKVVTATAAIDQAGIQPLHRIAYNGANYTLHKQNVLSDKINRWTRFITLKDAFARSINTAFGRLTLKNLTPEIISDYAEKFMFNSDLNTDFQVQRSVASVPAEKGFELTQVASGYNRVNTLSPVHGAMIASAIINGGKIPSPYIVESIKNEDQEIVYQATPLMNDPVMSKKSSLKVQELMEQTVLSGTSRKSFRAMVRDRKYREIEMGGKTGHFTGTNPKGTTDWFVGYAYDGDRKIAIATITVNVKKWTVKSAVLAKLMFKEYFKPLVANNEKRFANVSAERKRHP